MKFGLIGHNIEYSKSKEIFESQGFEYKVYDVPNVELGLQAAIDDRLDGFNITTPFKNDIIQYMDWLMPNADKTQSVNCVKILNDTFIGENFDSQAFINSLVHYVDNHDAWEFDFPHNIAILGNGGIMPSIKIGLKTGLEEQHQFIRLLSLQEIQKKINRFYQILMQRILTLL